MTKYDFLLTFRLPRSDANPEDYLDALYEAGCDDASIGTGRRGTIGLEFARRAGTAEEALQSAIRDVGKAIPEAMLLEAGPDLVNLADVADIVGCSRQNMRKYASGEARTARDGFPEPVFTGTPSLWHLAEIGSWLLRHAGVRPTLEVLEVSRAAARANLAIQERRVHRILEPS